MKITVISNFGRFAYRAEATVADGLTKAEANTVQRGIADTCFRAVGSDVEKALVKAGLATKETKRADIEFSEGAKEVVETTAQAKLNALAFDKNEPIVDIEFTVTGEHVYGETSSPMVRATALVDSFLGEPMEAAYREILSEQGDREALITKAHAMGLGIQPPKSKK